MQPASAEETIRRLVLSLSELEHLGETIVSGQVNFSASSQAYLRIVLETLCVTKGAILLFHPATSQLAIESSVNVEDESLVISILPDEIADAIQSPVLDLSDPPPALKPFFDNIRPQLDFLSAHLWAPLKIGDDFFGVLSLGPTPNRIEMASWNRELVAVLADFVSREIAHSRVLEEMRTAKFRLFLLSDITAQMSKLLDTARLESEVVHHAVSLLDARGGCFLLLDSMSQLLEMKSSFTMEVESSPELEDLKISLQGNGPAHPAVSLLREVALHGKTLIRNGAKEAEFFGGKNLMVVPIFGREILGVLLVYDKEEKDRITVDFTPRDGILLEAFANQAGVVIENARLYQEALERRRLQTEIDEASKIQKNLIPSESPEIPGYEVIGLSVPHHDEVGGDYYDYIQEQDGTWGFAVADVCGKGMQAALLMAMLRMGLRAEVARHKDLRTMATALNSLLYEGSTTDTYATLVYAKLDPEKGVLTSINAGHNLALVVRRDGSVKRLEKGGLVLGMYPDDMLRQIVEFEHETTLLSSGDTVLFYTDGVTETLNIDNEMYGEARLVELVKARRGATAAEICSAVYGAVLEFQGEANPFDDLTLMVLKRK